jgi:cytochrome c oxidase subunit 2
MTRFHRLLPYVALATLAVAGVFLVGLPSAGARSGGVARSVRVEARNFAFTPATIEVDPGDRVTIELASADVVHGLHIEGYDVNLTADPGQPATVSFVADRPGTYRIRCSVPCGPLHPFMSGRLRVGPPSTFWRAIALALIAVAMGGIALWRKPTRPGARLGPS